MGIQGMMTGVLVAMMAVSLHLAHPRHWSHGLWGRKPNCTLRYFDARGRAEPIRMALAIAGWPYEEITFSGDEWRSSIKRDGTASGLFTFGQVPQLSVEWGTGDVVHLTQSHAILRYISRHSDTLYGGSSPDTRALVDVVADGTADLRGAFKKIQYGGNFEAEIPEFYSVKAPVWLSHFERLFKTEGWERGVSGSITYADLLLSDLVDMLDHYQPSADGKSSHLLKGYPTLASWRHHVSQHPPLREYLASETRNARSP